MRAQLENFEISGLTYAQQESVEVAAASVVLIVNNNNYNLDEANSIVRNVFPGWFIYKGGSHIAVHQTAAGNSPRLVIFTER